MGAARFRLGAAAVVALSALLLIGIPGTATAAGTNPRAPFAVANPTVVPQGGGVTLGVKVVLGTDPASTGIAVNADLTAIGGSSAQQLFDDATHSDVVANDNLFVLDTTVAGSTPLGRPQIPVTITDAEGRSGTASISFLVTAGSGLSNRPPTVSAGGPCSVAEGSSTQLSATGSDPDGDPITYAWDLDGDGTFETPGQTVSYFAADGPATPTLNVRATDPSGASTVETVTVTITNVAPTVMSLVPSATTGFVGDPVTFTGTATDPSSVDVAAGFGWAFATGAGFGPFGSNGFAVTYSACGTYTVDAEARDKDGGVSDPFTSTPVQVYDASLLPPLASGAFNLVQKARTIPVKITVGCNGFLGGLHPAISIRAGEYDPTVDPSDPSYDLPDTSSAADTSGVMRETNGQYIYNLGLPSTAASGQLFTVLIRPFGGAAPTLYAVLKVK